MKELPTHHNAHLGLQFCVHVQDGSKELFTGVFYLEFQCKIVLMYRFLVAYFDVV